MTVEQRHDWILKGLALAVLTASVGWAGATWQRTIGTAATVDGLADTRNQLVSSRNRELDDIKDRLAALESAVRDLFARNCTK